MARAFSADNDTDRFFFSVWQGLGKLLDFSAALPIVRHPPTSYEEDVDALINDWFMIRRDIHHAANTLYPAEFQEWQHSQNAPPSQEKVQGHLYPPRWKGHQEKTS